MSPFRSMSFSVRVNPKPFIFAVIGIPLGLYALISLAFTQRPVDVAAFWFFCGIVLILIPVVEFSDALRWAPYLWARLGFILEAYPDTRERVNQVLPAVYNKLQEESENYLTVCLFLEYETKVIRKMIEQHDEEFKNFRPKSLDAEYLKWLEAHKQKTELLKKALKTSERSEVKVQRRKEYDMVKELHGRLFKLLGKPAINYSERLNGLRGELLVKYIDTIRETGLSNLSTELNIPKCEIPGALLDGEPEPSTGTWL